MEHWAILALVALAWVWHGSMRAREIACDEARAICQRMAWGWLDETVSLKSLGVARDGHGRLKLRRIYAFRYLEAAHRIHEGVVMLVGDEIQTVLLDTARLDA
ncbi:MAG: DUF3301 domain-containing protein [Magnetococcales bacterium]|nr:DUF3301 domain-containing protein [Magnetococcales bacterium]MBF0260362.1 DUF3301 domain-containing protein [Magnetococcales bacterium]